MKNRRGTRILFDLFIRIVFGIGLIFLANEGFAALNIPIKVGINYISILTTAALGFPGVLLLYGVSTYGIL